MMDKTIYILRHGETDFNRNGIVQGSGVDTSLNELGRKQAKAFFDAYSHIDFEVVITSRLKRTHQTLQPFIDKGLNWEQYHEINEISWGLQEGKAGTPQSKLEYRKVIEHWTNGNFDARMEEGESAADLAARVTRFVESLQNRTERNVLVCAHGRTMRCLMCVLSRVDISEMERFSHDNTGLWKVQLKEGHFHFEIENDTRHLDSIVVDSQYYE